MCAVVVVVPLGRHVSRLLIILWCAYKSQRHAFRFDFPTSSVYLHQVNLSEACDNVSTTMEGTFLT